ncbi:uncharacterized protein LOC111034499 [Myzus persicae]|uniref:uncharacterized protein LOC111034499 n=1 Tax=Myzus persicae TaxID=13164 RepID=UPI000B937B60|nr:uncharacterized protein LOC111034499 [Myzus persicae]
MPGFESMRPHQLMYNLFMLHMSDIEKDCLEYVTGSVARKFLSKYPSLGEKVGNVIGSDSSWTEQMSKGNLIKPSKSMIQVAKVLEVVFNEYHTKNTLRKTPGVMKNVRDILVSKLQNIIDIPVEVLECMVRTRTFIRLNSMNKQLMDKVISTKNKIKKFVS